MAGYVKELARTTIKNNNGPNAVELSWSIPSGATSIQFEATYGVGPYNQGGLNQMRIKWNGAWTGGSNASAKDAYLIQQIREYSRSQWDGMHNNRDPNSNGGRDGFGMEFYSEPSNYIWYDTSNSNEPWPNRGVYGYCLSPATTDNMKQLVCQSWMNSTSNNSSVDASYTNSQQLSAGVIDPYDYESVSKGAFTSIRFNVADSTMRFSKHSTFAVHAYGA